jgi:hypothetical protein
MKGECHKRSEEALVVASKKIELEINAIKTNHIATSLNWNAG